MPIHVSIPVVDQCMKVNRTSLGLSHDHHTNRYRGLGDNHKLKEEPNENLPNDDKTNVNHHGRTATRNFVWSGAGHKEAFCAGGAPLPLT